MLQVMGYTQIIVCFLIQLVASVLVVIKMVRYNLTKSERWLKPTFDSIKLSFIMLVPFAVFMALRVITSIVIQIVVSNIGDDFIIFFLYTNLALLGLLVLSSIVIGVLGLVKAIKRKSLLIIAVSLLTIVSIFNNSTILSASIFCFVLLFLHVKGQKKLRES